MIYNYVYLKFIEKIKQFDLTEKFIKKNKYNKYEMKLLILTAVQYMVLTIPCFIGVHWRKRILG